MGNYSVRTTNVLKNAGLTDVAAKKMRYQEIVDLPNSAPAVARELLWAEQCYGMSEAELTLSVDNAMFTNDRGMIAMSILSDVQELMLRATPENLELARQWVNKAKWIISQRLVDPIYMEEESVSFND